jgi:hypothetical protein
MNMSRVELSILYADGNTTKTRVVVNKWKFQDAMMGEQFITFNVTSEKPIDWGIGDYCVFRGETFTLNYIPSVTQKARTGDTQDAYTYENVKFDSHQEELTRCLMLDITPTTDLYQAVLGTNYTGSSKFQLFCGEVTYSNHTYTAVCALALKMQANLDRLYGTNTWQVLVDTTTTYTSATGATVLVTHTDDKVVSFDNTSVAKALSEVHSTFDLDYCVKGRVIYIGYNLKNLTSDNDFETFAFGYGKGYPTVSDSGKALFQIKRISNQQQQIVTRLRALGSTKNMPYRYYNDAYDLSQALFPLNLQLPDTFLPETGVPSKKRNGDPNNKTAGNALRDDVYKDPNTGSPYFRHVKGDTNDAYIDKNDDAESCVEGVREDSARWDGSNSNLPEIYPTIEEATYGDLRGASVEDQDGHTESTGTSTDSHGRHSFLEYEDDERIDSLLAIGYLDNGTLVDDANRGDGILPESGATDNGLPIAATISFNSLTYSTHGGDFISRGIYRIGPERTLFTISNVSPGRYAMVPGDAGYVAVLYSFNISYNNNSVSADVGFQINIDQKSKETNEVTNIATYASPYVNVSSNSGASEMALPDLPDVKEGSSAQVTEIEVTENSDIIVTFTPVLKNVVTPNNFSDTFTFQYQVGQSRLPTDNTYDPEYVWKSLDESVSQEESFHVFIKDMGFEITASSSGDTPVVAMKSGRCVGREFEIGSNIQKVTYDGKKGYMLTLHRAKDSSLNTYYPSATDPIAAGDYYVLLNITMPEAYIKMAEVRLLRAATDYLADNCETQYTYQPYLDDIYLQRNYDNMVAAGTPQSSIFWRLYAGLKFTFRGIPSNENAPLPLAELTIDKLTISMGEGLTPKVEMTLNDDVQQTTLQKLTTSVDRIYNGSLFGSGVSGGGGLASWSAALLSLLQSEGGKLFLSKRVSDTAAGRITFDKGFKSDADGKFGTFVKDASGAGIWQDEDQNWHIEGDYVHARKKLTAKELQIEEITHSGGRILLSAAEMVCSHVVEHPAYYRCYFLREDDDGKKIYNKFKIGDQAIMQSFNEGDSEAENTNRFYWRLVVGMGSETSFDFNNDYNNDYAASESSGTVNTYYYIDLSKTDCAYLSDAPRAEDKIVQLGYRYDDDISRQNAIILAGAGTESPYIREYVGINSYVLPSPETQLRPGDNILSGLVQMQPGSQLPDGSDVSDTLTSLFDEQTDLREDMEGLDTGNANLLRNSGFTGDYQSADVTESTLVGEQTQIYSPYLKYWQSENVVVNSDPESASGMSATLTRGMLSQVVDVVLEPGSIYSVSFKGSGESLYLTFGGHSESILLDSHVTRKVIKLTCSSPQATTFQVVGTGRLMELMLNRGGVPNADWLPSPLDNDKVLAEQQNMTYLLNAITNASTSILGGLILTQMIRVGNYRDGVMASNGETGGMSGLYNSGNSPFLWGGGSMEQALYTISKYARDPSYMASTEEVSQMAKFVVTHGGRAILNDIVLRGYIYALGGYFKGEVHADKGVFRGDVYANSGFFKGEVHAESGEFKNVSSPNGNFSIDSDGNFSCQDARIGGQLYTPLFVVNRSNWMQCVGPSAGSSYQLLLNVTGLNVQIDHIDFTGGGNVNIYLPTSESYVGANLHLLNNMSSGFVVIMNCTYYNKTLGIRTDGLKEIKSGELSSLLCYKDNGTVRWVLATDPVIT